MKQRDKCSYADKYQAQRAPTCGCLACEVKWAQRYVTFALREQA